MFAIIDLSTKLWEAFIPGFYLFIFFSNKSVTKIKPAFIGENNFRYTLDLSVELLWFFVGGHPHNWNKVVSVCVSVLKELSDTVQETNWRILANAPVRQPEKSSSNTGECG